LDGWFELLLDKTGKEGIILKADATPAHHQPLLHHLLKRSITSNFNLGFCLGAEAGLSL
jgi:hypothetical protein